MTQFLQEHDRRRAFFAEGHSSKGKKSPELNEQTEEAKGKGGGGKAQTKGKCPLNLFDSPSCRESEQASLTIETERGQ